MDKFIIKNNKENNKEKIKYDNNFNNIKGLKYIQNFIDDDMENELINYIDNQIWNNEIKRRTIHYGYSYSYIKKNSINKIKEIPEELIIIKNKMEKYVNKEFDQIIINEYLPGQGINNHIDNPKLFNDTIISLSLLSDIDMEFTNNKTNEVNTLKLERKSILILQNEARYNYLHGIKNKLKDKNIKRKRRVSITFRKVNDNYI